jgi:hypothetical protein
MEMKECIGKQLEKCFKNSKLPCDSRVKEIIKENFGTSSTFKERNGSHAVVTLEFSDTPLDVEFNLIPSLNGEDRICHSLGILN